MQKLCRRVLIIDQGKLLFDGALETLRNRFGGKWQLIVDFADVYQNVVINGADLLHFEDSRATYAFDRNVLSSSDLIGQISAKYNIQDVSVQEPDIEVTIRSIYEGKLLKNG